MSLSGQQSSFHAHTRNTESLASLVGYRANTAGTRKGTKWTRMWSMFCAVNTPKGQPLITEILCVQERLMSHIEKFLKKTLWNQSWATTFQWEIQQNITDYISKYTCWKFHIRRPPSFTGHSVRCTNQTRQLSILKEFRAPLPVGPPTTASFFLFSFYKPVSCRYYGTRLKCFNCFKIFLNF